MNIAVGKTICAAILVSFAQSLAAQATSKPEEVEWTWEVRPAQVNALLPNVLLEGDSITRNLYPEVTRRLAGKANVYLMASSISVGDPRLPGAIRRFAQMERVPFAVVHFNNGMHGWTYSEQDYERAFPAFVQALRAIAPKAVLIWATTTPVRKDAAPGPTKAGVDTRNAIAAKYTRGMMVDDQHALMLRYGDERADDVHFNEKGSNAGGAQAAALIETALTERHQQRSK